MAELTSAFLFQILAYLRHASLGLLQDVSLQDNVQGLHTKSISGNI